jgi:hypothetical protein
MPILRLAYATQFLIALIAVYVLWSQVGGQGHLDLIPWHIKLLFGCGAAFCVVKATAAAVDGARAWNGKSLRWFGILLLLLAGCGLASYYVHLYDESDEDDQQDNSAISMSGTITSCATLGPKCANPLSWRCSAPASLLLPGGRKDMRWWPASLKRS